MSSSIQFRGIDGVVSAYENREIAPWSLWQGKQFMFKYEGNNVSEGSAQLMATLELLKESSNAIYTLKVYEDLPKGGKIKSNTPDDGSFNFKINGDEQAITQNQYASLKYNNGIAERLERIEQRLMEEEEEEAEPENKLGVIGEIISHPTIAPILQNIMAAIFSKGQNAAPAPQMQRVAISGVNDETELKEAVEALKKHDSKLTEHLQKLAALAQQSPDSFKFLLTTLDNM